MTDPEQLEGDNFWMFSLELSENNFLVVENQWVLNECRLLLSYLMRSIGS